jgi:adenylate cyclase
MPQSRQLAAIMFTDIVGYTAMMQQNEQKAVAVIKHYNATLERSVSQFNGRVLNYYGDGSLCIFHSALDAVSCSLEVQKELKNEPVVPLRIGLHIGEVFFEEDKALGDGVNVASRVQSLGSENTILVSAEFYDKIKNNSVIAAKSLGAFYFKNVDKPMEVFALTNEGLSVPQRKKIEGKLKKKNSSVQPILAIVFIILFAAVAFFVYEKFLYAKARLPVADKSIAVLPFVDMSVNKDQEYLADGLSEEIINSITAINTLKVIGRTSSFQFKGKGLDAGAIGEKLNVSFILEGSIQKSGNNLRITTQLIRVRDNSTVWSQRFDKELKDIFAIQDSIASNIVENLKITLLESERPRLIKKETAPEVYSQYLKGLYTYKENEYEKSIEYNLAAIKADSLFAPPYAYIALSKIWIINRNHVYTDFNAIREAKEFAHKSISLDPDLAEGYSALGLLAWTIELDFTEAKLNFEKSIQLNPSASLIKNRYAYFLLWMGEFDKAEALGLDAISSDPADFNGYVIVSNAYIYKKKFDEAEKSIAEGRRLFPGNAGFERLAIEQKFYSGNYEQVIQSIKPLLAKSPSAVSENLLSFLCIAYLKKSDLTESKNVLRQLREKREDKNYNINYCLARIYSQYQMKDSCFLSLEKSITNREEIFRLFKIDPLFDNIRQDKRYQQLYRRYGFERYK